MGVILWCTRQQARRAELAHEYHGVLQMLTVHIAKKSTTKDLTPLRTPLRKGLPIGGKFVIMLGLRLGFDVYETN